MKRFFRKLRSNKCVKRVKDVTKRNPVAAGALAVAAGTISLGLPADVLAWTVPAQGSFLYNVYDIAVNQMLDGALGFIIGMGCIAAGGYFIANSRAGGMASGVPMILLGGVLANLDTVTQTLGFMV